MKDNDTTTLEWLLEKGLGYEFSTMFDEENLNFKDVVENEKSKNNVFAKMTDESELYTTKTSDYNFEQKKININIKNKRFSDDIRDTINNICNKHVRTNNTFYKNIYEYHGVVESIDTINQRFTALLVNSDDSGDMLSAEFSLMDVGYESDKNLIEVGVNIIWMIGQEQQVVTRNGVLVQGTQQNVSKFIVRRPQGLNNKKIREAKDEAKKWSEFFKRFESSNTTD